MSQMNTQKKIKLHFSQKNQKKNKKNHKKMKKKKDLGNLREIKLNPQLKQK